MTHDADFELFPWKGFDYFPHQIDGFSPSSSYTNPQSDTQIYAKQPAPVIPSVYDSCMRQSWASDGTISSGSGPAQHPNGSKPCCARGKAYMIEAENIANGSMLSPKGVKAEGYQHGQTSLPVGQRSKGKRCNGGRAGHSPPHSHRAATKAKSRFIGQATCGWAGCTSKRFYSYDTSLWRHIKEKHLRPDSFKCPAPHCAKSFGRNDKLAEHWQSAHSDGDSLKDNHCHSCHAGFHEGGWS